MSGSMPPSLRGSGGMAMMPHELSGGPVPTHLRSRVYVGNIPWQMSDDDVAMCFSQIGTVREAKVVLDRDTGRSKGFAFVTFETEECARMAIERWNGSQLGGRTIKIGQAQPPSSAAAAMTMGPGSMHPGGAPMTLMPPGGGRAYAPMPGYPPSSHAAYGGGYGYSEAPVPPSFGGGRPGMMYAPPSGPTPHEAQYLPPGGMQRRAPPPGAPSGGGSFRGSLPGPYAAEPSYVGPIPQSHAPPPMHMQQRYGSGERGYSSSSPTRSGAMPDGRAALAFASGTPVPPADLASDTGYSGHMTHSSESSTNLRIAHDTYASGDSAVWYSSGKDAGEAPSHTTIFGDGWRTEPTVPDSIDSIAASVAQLALDHRTSTTETPATWSGARDATATYPATGSGGSGEYGTGAPARGRMFAPGPPGLASMSTLPPDTSRYMPAGAAAQLHGVPHRYP